MGRSHDIPVLTALESPCPQALTLAPREGSPWRAKERGLRRWGGDMPPQGHLAGLLVSLSLNMCPWALGKLQEPPFLIAAGLRTEGEASSSRPAAGLGRVLVRLQLLWSPPGLRLGAGAAGRRRRQALRRVVAPPWPVAATNRGAVCCGCQKRNPNEQQLLAAGIEVEVWLRGPGSPTAPGVGGGGHPSRDKRMHLPCFEFQPEGPRGSGCPVCCSVPPTVGRADTCYLVRTPPEVEAEDHLPSSDPSPSDRGGAPVAGPLGPRPSGLSV